MSKLFKASVVENHEVQRDHYRITLHPLNTIQRPDPGNFFMVKMDKRLDPLLNRPLSVHNWNDNGFELLYRVVGKGTVILSKKKPGDILDILGPVGNSFPLHKKRKNIILVAGGLGIAPLFYVAHIIANRKPLLFYGAKKKEELLCTDELSSLGIETVISTDDGSFGRKGVVTKLVKHYLLRHFPGPSDYLIFACGPRAMLKSLAGLVTKRRIEGYVALEENMACGIGTCLGCCIETRSGFKRVCKDGPIFKMDEVVW